MNKIVLLLAFVGYLSASYLPNSGSSKQDGGVKEKPMPYEFRYDISDDDGNKQGRQEKADDQGVVKGSYFINLADGRRRWVEYIADDNGYRVVMKTNEPGTEDKDPANVDLTVDGPIVIKEVPKQKTVKYSPAPAHKY